MSLGQLSTTKSGLINIQLGKYIIWPGIVKLQLLTKLSWIEHSVDHLCSHFNIINFSHFPFFIVAKLIKKTWEYFKTEGRSLVSFSRWSCLYIINIWTPPGVSFSIELVWQWFRNLSTRFLDIVIVDLKTWLMRNYSNSAILKFLEKV